MSSLQPSGDSKTLIIDSQQPPADSKTIDISMKNVQMSSQQPSRDSKTLIMYSQQLPADSKTINIEFDKCANGFTTTSSRFPTIDNEFTAASLRLPKPLIFKCKREQMASQQLLQIVVKQCIDSQQPQVATGRHRGEISEPATF